MTTPIAENYYTAHEAQLLKDLDKQLPHFKHVLNTEFAPDEVTRIIQQTREEFRRLLPRLPDIGGRQNPLTENLLASAWFLALAQPLRQRNWSDDQIGDLIYRIAEVWVASSPRWVAWLQGKLARTPLVKFLLKRVSRQSQQRRYAADFVVQFVEGNGRNFDFGLDFTECGICKLFQAEGAAGLAKHMCRIDYLTTSFRGIQLIRTGTIANGASKCDFRYKQLPGGQRAPQAIALYE